MFSFLAILLNSTDWAITDRIALVQFNSTLERKVKTRALKGIFMVRKWINNILKSNSVRYHMHHWKNLSFLSSFGLRAVFVKGSKIAVFVSIVTSKRARWPPLFITFLSSSWLVTSVYQVSSTIYVRFFYQGITLNDGSSTKYACESHTWNREWHCHHVSKSCLSMTLTCLQLACFQTAVKINRILLSMPNHKDDIIIANISCFYV